MPGGIACRAGHHTGQRRDPLTVKRRLRDPTLPQPEVALACQQAVAKKHPQFVVERALVIVARVVLQHVTNVGGVGDEVAVPRTDLEVDDLAIAASGVHEHSGRISPHGGQHAKERHAARSRRKLIHGTGSAGRLEEDERRIAAEAGSCVGAKRGGAFGLAGNRPETGGGVVALRRGRCLD